MFGSAAARKREILGVTVREGKDGEVHFDKAGVDGVAVWITVVSHEVLMPEEWDEAREGKSCPITLHICLWFFYLPFCHENNFQTLD